MEPKVMFSDNVKLIEQHLVHHPGDVNVIPSFSITPLLHAVEKERIDVIDCLLAHGCNINYQNDDGNTALHIACRTGNIDIIQRLIQAGADGMIRNNDPGNTPLHEASYGICDKNVLHRLFYISDFNSINNNGITPLMVACLWNKDVEIIKCIADKTYNIDYSSFNGPTAFYYLCLADNYGAFEYFLERGANPFVSVGEHADPDQQHTPYNVTSLEGKSIIDNFLRLKTTST